MNLRCLVVDDEPIARQGMREYIQATEFLSFGAEASNADEAETFLAQQKFDLMLLDVQMPGKTGMAFLRTIKDPPIVIITTAFPEFALEGFELDVIDYLLKPIPYARFLKAVTKARDFLSLKTPIKNSSPEPDYIFLKSNGKFERVYFNDILFVEGMQNYVIVHMLNQRLVVYMTMVGMEAQLPPQKFMRVHKSYIVALAKVRSIQNHDLILDGFKVPVSRALFEVVRSQIMGDRFASRL